MFGAVCDPSVDNCLPCWEQNENLIMQNLIICQEWAGWASEASSAGLNIQINK